MKKRLVTYLLLTAMAAFVFAGCEDKDADAFIAEEGSTATAVVEEAPVESTVQEAEAAPETPEVLPIEDPSAIDDSTQEEADAGSTEEAFAEEFADEEVDSEPIVAVPSTESEDLIVDPGTIYEVRFGGNVYATMDEVDSNIIDYVYPGYQLQIDERNDNYWYKVTYWIDGSPRTGYIKIQ